MCYCHQPIHCCYARMREKGIALVGCNQFFSSYVAYGGDSIMWKVYANRVCRLRFFSLLCRTDPWIKTKSPIESPEKDQLIHRKCHLNMITRVTGLKHILADRGWDLLGRCRQLFEARAARWQTNETLRNRGRQVRSREDRESAII